MQESGPVCLLSSQAPSTWGGFEFYLIRATEYRFRREGGSGIPVLARRQYLYLLPWVGARECRPRVSGGKKWTTGWSRPLGPFFRAYRAGKQKQPFFFPYKTEITNAREKLVAQRRRREGVYNRVAGASVTFPGGAGTRERADSPRPGGWSIADFVSAKRNAGEFCFLCFITKEVPARHEGCRLVPQQKSNPPRLCRVRNLSLSFPKETAFVLLHKLCFHARA